MQAREQIFHHPRADETAADLEHLLTEDFWRVGATGAIYSREHSLKIFADRFDGPTVRMPWSVTDDRVQQLDRTTFLHTYRLRFTGRVTVRSTVWSHYDYGWVAHYHQATEVRDA